MTPFSRSHRPANSTNSRAVVRVSPSARCAVSGGNCRRVASAPKALLPVPNRPRANPSVSMIGFMSGGAPASRNSWMRNGRSNGALWNTSARSPHAARSVWPTDAMLGALATMSSRMPCTRVASGGIGRAGLTSELHSPASTPSVTVTCATSTRRCPSAGFMPVVSVSTANTVLPLSRPMGPPFEGNEPCSLVHRVAERGRGRPRIEPHAAQARAAELAGVHDRAPAHRVAPCARHAR